MDRLMAGYFGNTEALGRPVAPGGFNPGLPPRLHGFVEFGEATFRAGASEALRPHHEAGLLGSLVYRPMVFRRNDVGWIAACAWRASAKADDVAALKRAKRNLDRPLIDGAAELLAGLVHQLRGNRAADAITSVPCGHSRRSDCLGTQIAQAVAEALSLAFLQIFADRPCSGVSHPKEFAKLPPLERIAKTDRETIETTIGGLPIGTVVITGGARGPDRWAEQAARTQRFEVVVHRPDLDGVRARWQAAERFYARNQRIVDDADLVIAFVAADRTGGTEDTIRRAVRAGKPVELR
jgi:hypothetical protein